MIRDTAISIARTKLEIKTIDATAGKITNANADNNTAQAKLAEECAEGKE
jgi:hypothetical protein